MTPVNIPPIAALRALEAAARHGSYARAAEELHVTPSAISHQIRHAQDMLGFELFTRREGESRPVLTEAGKTLIPVVHEFLRRFATTVEGLTDQQRDSSNALHVSLLQSLALKWLVPRLGNFNRKHPDIDVWISTSEDLVSLCDEAEGGVDVAIRLGTGNWENLYEERLLTEYAFPVCSPEFLRRTGKPRRPQELLKLPLLRRGVVGILPNWSDWFREAGVIAAELPHGTRFPQVSMALEAAMDDQGIALARGAHVFDDLKAGRLVHLFPEVKCRSSAAYYFVCGRGRENDPHIAPFRAWLVEEAQETQEALDRMFQSDRANDE